MKTLILKYKPAWHNFHNSEQKILETLFTPIKIIWNKEKPECLILLNPKVEIDTLNKLLMEFVAQADTKWIYRWKPLDIIFEVFFWDTEKIH